jgi:hypothetical protein
VCNNPVIAFSIPRFMFSIDSVAKAMITESPCFKFCILDARRVRAINELPARLAAANRSAIGVTG